MALMPESSKPGVDQAKSSKLHLAFFSLLYVSSRPHAYKPCWKYTLRNKMLQNNSCSIELLGSDIFWFVTYEVF